MMEEALKPLVVWLFAGKIHFQAQGFALGALCGAGFALVETFNNSAQSDAWAIVLIARIGTGAMHITTSALMGAAIFSALHERRYLRLIATYLLAVFLHGLWNLLAVTNGFSSLLIEVDGGDSYQFIERSSGIGLALLTLILITILVNSNRKQPRKTEIVPPLVTIE
jgi:RsiW-degrading membrane proteinase PrsW (M82 family)